MKKTTQIWLVLIFLLFAFPIALQYVPKKPTLQTTLSLKEPSLIVYASNVTEDEIKPKVQGNVLVYSTHSHEAYEPITKAVDGKVAASHQSENILKVGGKLQKQLEVNGVQAEHLNLDITMEMKKKKIPYHRSYAAIRPHIAKRVQNTNYDLIIDLHRDSIGASKTTLEHKGIRYAKVAFVVGRDHAYYEKNLTKARQLKAELEKRVPGITRDIIIKGGRGVDGKYNQDLNTSMILVELGGVGNTETEVQQTISVIAESIPQIMARP